LQNTYQTDDDAAVAAMTLYESASENLYDYLQKATHAKRLSGLDFEKDIRFCLELNRFDNLPVIVNGMITNREKNHG
jgi:2-phosphosulfolactate phosphatase